MRVMDCRYRGCRHLIGATGPWALYVAETIHIAIRHGSTT